MNGSGWAIVDATGRLVIEAPPDFYDDGSGLYWRVDYETGDLVVTNTVATTWRAGLADGGCLPGRYIQPLQPRLVFRFEGGLRVRSDTAQSVALNYLGTDQADGGCTSAQTGSTFFLVPLDATLPVTAAPPTPGFQPPLRYQRR